MYYTSCCIRSQVIHRTQIYLEDSQYEYLKRTASENGISIAALIRRLLDKQLPMDEDYEDNPLFTIGQNKFTMGQPDGSSQHDENLYQPKK